MIFSNFSEKKLIKICWIFFYIATFLLLLNNSLYYLDPDFGWHLKFGEAVWKNKEIPLNQTYLWIVEGQNWVNHEWLADTLMYLVWEMSGGYMVINILLAIIPTLSLILIIGYIKKRHELNIAQNLVLLTISFTYLLGILPHSGVRIQQLSVLFIVILLIILNNEKSRPSSYFYWLIPFVYLWSNLHGGFLLGIIILFSWVVYQWLVLLINKKNFFIKKIINQENIETKKLKKITLIVFLSSLSTLFTPYGFYLYGFLKDYTNTAYLSYIQEWRPLIDFLPTNNLHVFQLIYILIILSFLFWLILYYKKITWWKIILIFGLCLMSLRSTRHFPIFGGASLLLIVAPVIKDIIRKDLSSGVIKISLWFLLVSSFLCSLLMFNELNYKKIKNPFYHYCDQYPCQAVDFIKNNKDLRGLKIINDYAWGGYLIAVWPEKRIFMDGRLPQYPYKNHTLIEEYVEFNKKNLTEEKLKEYEAELVLWKTPAKPRKTTWFGRYFLMMNKYQNTPSNNVGNFLSENKEWALVYKDEIALIYVKRTK